jgi:hypothetical protein
MKRSQASRKRICSAFSEADVVLIEMAIYRGKDNRKRSKSKSKSCHVDKGGQELCLEVTVYHISKLKTTNACKVLVL